MHDQINLGRPTLLSMLLNTNETKPQTPYDPEVTAKHLKQEEQRIEDRFRSLKTGGFPRIDSSAEEKKSGDIEMNNTFQIKR